LEIILNIYETLEKQPKNKEFLKRMFDEKFRQKHNPIKARAEINQKFGRDTI